MYKRTALEMLVQQGAMEASPDLMPVIADDACEWHDRMIDQGRSVTDMIPTLRVRPPWSHTWLDVRLLDSTERPHPTLRVGIDVHGGRADLLATGMQRLFAKHATMVQAMRPINAPNAIGGVFLVAGPAQHQFAGAFLGGCDAEWRRTDEEYQLIVPRDAVLDVNVWATITCHILGLLHVKNAELIDRPVPRAERRRAEKSGQPVIKVKELVIAPMRRALQQMLEHEAASPGEPLPLHLCRGHFKTFTAERPLLGRHVGTFWWEPHLRGSEQVGIVVHDEARIEMPRSE